MRTISADSLETIDSVSLSHSTGTLSTPASFRTITVRCDYGQASAT